MAVTICQTGISDIIGGLPELTSSPFLRDTRIICRDGTLVANSFLLSRWADVVRLHLKENAMVSGLQGNPLTLVLPDFQTSLVSKILAWTCTGRVKVTSAEVIEATKLLMSMGATVAYSTEQIVEKQYSQIGDDLLSTFQEDVNGHKYQTSAKINNKDQICDNSSKDALKEISGKSVVTQQTVLSSNKNKSSPRPPQKPNVKVATDFACILCPKRGRNLSTLLDHYSIVHYKAAILRVWGSDDLDAPCPICDKDLTAAWTKSKMGSKVKNICRHVGSLHGKIFSICSPKVKKSLESFKQALNKSQDKSAKFVECTEELKRTYPGCDSCREGFSGPKAMKSHLSQVHLYKKLTANFGDRGNSCNLCGMSFRPSAADYTFNSAQHIMANHPEVVLALLPPRLAGLMRKVCVATADKKPFSCPLCNAKARSFNRLERHMALIHFREDLQNLKEMSSDSRKCSICSASLGSDNMKPSEQRKSMAEHIGVKHKLLYSVIPLDLKSKMEEIRKAKRPSSKEEKMEDEEDFDIDDLVAAENIMAGNVDEGLMEGLGGE